MAIILDNLLCTLMIFLLSFAWAYYCTHSSKASFICATVIALCSSYVLHQLLKKYFGRKQDKQIKKSKLQALLNYLQFGTENEKLMAKMLNYYNFSVLSMGDNFVIAQKQNKTTYFACCFDSDKLTQQQMISCVVNCKKLNADRLYVACNSATSQVVALANNVVPTYVIDSANLYQLLEQSNLLPTTNFTVAVRKNTAVASILFTRNKAKVYLANSLFLLFLSLFSYAKIYNIIWASIMFLLAMYSLFNKKYNVRTTTITLN